MIQNGSKRDQSNINMHKITVVSVMVDSSDFARDV